MTAHSPTDTQNAAHILVIDDDRRICTLLTRYLTERGYRVSAAADAEEARRRMAGIRFDLLVLDVMMPGESGLSLARGLTQSPPPPVLMLSARAAASERIEGLETGAQDYLVKPFEPRELLLRIETILARARAETLPDSVRFGSCVFEPKRGRLTRGATPVQLTSGEEALLRLLARANGRTVSRLEIAAALSGVSERGVDVRINRLRRKIEDDPRAPLCLQTVRNAGYVLRLG